MQTLVDDDPKKLIMQALVVLGTCFIWRAYFLATAAVLYDIYFIWHETFKPGIVLTISFYVLLFVWWVTVKGCER